MINESQALAYIPSSTFDQTARSSSVGFGVRNMSTNARTSQLRSVSMYNDTSRKSAFGANRGGGGGGTRQISIAFRPSINIEAKAMKNKLEEIKLLRRSFLWFSIVASTNHALLYVVTSYTTSLLAPTLAGVVLGLLWTLNAVSGLTIATPACLYLGFKKSMLLSLTGYAFQVSALFLAVIIPHEPSKWAIAVLGSLVAGITSAIWWTAQGIYFEHVSQEIALRLVVDENDYSSDTVNNNNSEGVLPIDQIRADLSADWTIIYQGADVAVFLCLSLLTLSRSISTVSVIGGLSVVGGVTAALGTTFDSIESDDAVEISIADIQRAVVAVPRQYRNDCRATLLAPFVFGFGISTAMFASYVNSEIISHYLGTDSLGYLEAFSYLIAIIVAYPYAYIANNIDNGRDLVIQFGSTAFLLTGLFVLVLNPDTLGTYVVMFSLKGLYGLGRGVFEGSCRAVYASMFTGEDLSTAFSGQTLAAGFSGGLCFFMFIYFMRTTIGIIVVVNGVLAVLSYFIIMNMTERNSIMSWSVLLGLSIIIPPSSTDGKGDDVANVIHTRDIEIPPIGAA